MVLKVALFVSHLYVIFLPNKVCGEGKDLSIQAFFFPLLLTGEYPCTLDVLSLLLLQK